MNLHAKTPAEGLFDSNAATAESADDREHAGSPGAAEVARRGLRQDRSQEGGGGQGPVRDALRGLPQRLALHLDRAQQVRQALRPGRPDAAEGTSAPTRASSRTCGPTPRQRSSAPICPGRSRTRTDRPDRRSVLHPAEGTARDGAREAQADRGGDPWPARLPRVSAAAAAQGRVQGRAARRRLGHAAVHAQRLGAQPVRNADPGQGAHEEVLRRARVRPGQGRAGHQRELRQVPASTPRSAATRTPATRSRTARAATASSARC